MTTAVATIPAPSLDTSKKSLSVLAAEAHSAAPKVALKSKWMAIFEQFIMVRILSFSSLASPDLKEAQNFSFFGLTQNFAFLNFIIGSRSKRPINTLLG